MPPLGKESYLSSLDFDNNPSSAYVTFRETRISRPSTAAETAPGQSCNIKITGQGWLDVASIAIVLTLRLAGGPSTPIGHASNLISRIQTYIQGSPCENIEHYHRACAAFRTMTPQHVIDDEKRLGFMTTANETIADGTMTVVIRPWLLGLCRQGKHIPLTHAAVALEFTMAQPNEVFRRIAAVAAAAGPPAVDAVAAHYPSYMVTNAYVRHDILQISEALESKLMSSLLQNQAITLSFPSIHVQQEPVIFESPFIKFTTSKAYARLLAVLCTFTDTVVPGDDAVNEAAAVAGTNPERMLWPGGAAHNPHKNDSQCFEFRTQVGTRSFPDRPVRTLSEMYMQLQDLAGDNNQDVKSLSFSGSDFYRNKFVLCQSLMRIVGNPASGEVTRQGSPISVEITNISGPRVRMMYVFLPHLLTASIEERGTTVAN